MRVTHEVRTWTLDPPFGIAGKVSNEIETVHVRITDDNGREGSAETAGVSYLGESAAGISATINEIAGAFVNGMTQERLRRLLPAGGARNGLDCALWDLEYQRTGQTVADMLGLAPLQAIPTAFTIGLSSLADAEKAARVRAAGHKLVKVKVDAERHIERIEAVRAARPDATLLVDANQSWTRKLFTDLEPRLIAADIAVLEQPLPRGVDRDLDGYDGPLMLMADESCQTTKDFDRTRALYRAINIKLDKTGGLTEALRLAEAAKEADMTLMVGNMCGSSLAMAPAYLVGQLCDFADLDGPLLQTQDVVPGLDYRDGIISAPGGGLWGGL